MTTPSGVEVSLSNQDQWEKFHPMTEMVVTRKAGRRLFPHLKYILKGLDPDAKYGLFLHFERMDNIKYKFSVNKWKEFAKGDEIRPIERKLHKDGWRLGGHWMENPVSFEYFKITNDPEMDKDDAVLVQSMHKHIPVLSIQRENAEKEEFRFGVTEFMAVTAYQNKNIIQLKIEMNRFASGFKEDGGHNKSPVSGSSPRGVKRQSTSPEVYGSVTPPSAPWTPPYNPLTPLRYNNTPVAPMYHMYPWQMPMGMYPMFPPMSSGMAPGMAPGVPMNSSMPPVADVFQNQPAMQQNPIYMGMPMGQWNMGNGNGMENRTPQSEFPNYTF
ncbi:hypothetical protein CRE_09627 [Caenorhabditis remanei]|uniref:T-box domain-containing protein n=1 Tax=Caenorhabditis remanei TaxID=31234 RepID=E3MJ11_CAERE|nr:hypothetical protein CRE_09627 [Caenorhabditis remanei]